MYIFFHIHAQTRGPSEASHQTTSYYHTFVVNKAFFPVDWLLVNSYLKKRLLRDDYRRKNVTFPPVHPSSGCSQANTIAAWVYWRFAPSSPMLCYLLDSNVSLSQKIHFYVMYNYGEQNTLFFPTSKLRTHTIRSEKSQIFGKSANWIFFDTIAFVIAHCSKKYPQR